MSEKIRSAPAIPITIELICCDSWLTFPVNCFVIERNGTRISTDNTPIVPAAMQETDMFGIFERMNIPPSIALIT